MPVRRLEELLRERGALEPGEVVTIGCAVASALGALHALGVVHGGVSAAAVVMRPDGGVALTRPLPGSGAAAAGDVSALVALLGSLLPGEGDQAGAVRAVLDTSLPLDRLATALVAACPALPLRMADEDPERADDDAARTAVAAGKADRGPARRAAAASHGGSGPRSTAGVALATGLVAAALAAAIWAVHGAPWSRDPGGAPAAPATRMRPGSPGQQPGSPPWPEILASLDRARGVAFSTADPRALSRVYAPGTAELAADTSAIERLRVAGAVARDVRHRVVSVHVAAAGPLRTTLEVAEALAPYSVVGADGVSASVPAGPVRRFRLQLVRTPDGWRVADVASISSCSPGRGGRSGSPTPCRPS